MRCGARNRQASHHGPARSEDASPEMDGGARVDTAVSPGPKPRPFQFAPRPPQNPTANGARSAGEPQRVLPPRPECVRRQGGQITYATKSFLAWGKIRQKGIKCQSSLARGPARGRCNINPVLTTNSSLSLSAPDRLEQPGRQIPPASQTYRAMNRAIDRVKTRIFVHFTAFRAFPPGNQKPL